jgi:hypothetical protein
MLGDLVYEGKGKITGKRVLEVNTVGAPKLEISQSVEGMLKGNIEHRDVDQGIGVTMTRDGRDSIYLWTRNGKNDGVRNHALRRNKFLFNFFYRKTRIPE